jgi:hypothetical protein
MHNPGDVLRDFFYPQNEKLVPSIARKHHHKRYYLLAIIDFRSYFADEKSLLHALKFIRSLNQYLYESGFCASVAWNALLSK